jgi:outer membrane protein assembly factor BamB
VILPSQKLPVIDLKRQGFALVVFAGLAVVGYLAWRPQGGDLIPEASSFSSASGSDEWVMEGHDPARTRFTGVAVELPLDWQRELQVGGDTGSGSPPIVVDDLALVEAEGRLVAVDLRTGRQRWEFPQDGSYISPAVAGRRVFIRVESGALGQLVALDLESGEQVWAFGPAQLSEPATGFLGGHLTSPVVADGAVFVGAGRQVYALDAGTGELLWEFAMADYVSSSAAVANSHVYISDLSSLYVLDQQGGSQIWSYPTQMSIYFSPVASEGLVLYSDAPNVVALDTTTGEQRWVADFSGEAVIPAAVSECCAFVKSASTLYALDLASGAELWRFDDNSFVSLPAVADGQIFAVTGLSSGTALAILDSSTGSSRWMSIAALSPSAPVIAGQTVYVRASDGRLLGFWH